MKLLIKSILSNGCALGKIKSVDDTSEYIKSNTTEELKRFYEARDITIKQLSELKNNNEDMVDYLIIQEHMVLDPNLELRVNEHIMNNYSAVEAIKKSMQKYKEGLLKSSSTYLQERVIDIDDVEYRIVNNLASISKEQVNHPYILNAQSIFPSYLIANKNNLIGVIVKKCGYTSHVAIMCRNYDIPLVISDEDFSDDEVVIIDTAKNLIIKNPNADEINDYSKRISKDDHFSKNAVSHEGYLFLANVQSNEDLKRVIEYGFDGVGLYRTEIVFMNTNRPLTLEEQYNIYSEACEIMKDKSICFRTFDIGDDKKISYIRTHKKGIDNYKNNPQLFTNQVKAMLMANKYNNIKIMFPMVETNEEFLYLKDWVIKIANEFNFNIPQIGMMLETKEALENIETFTSVDFISIGTNDLTSDLYKLDRDNAIEMIEEYKTDLIDKLKAVVKHCSANNISLSVCGELAAVFNIACLFYSIGIKNLSVAPSSIRTLNSIYMSYMNE